MLLDNEAISGPLYKLFCGASISADHHFLNQYNKDNYEMTIQNPSLEYMIFRVRFSVPESEEHFCEGTNND